MKQPLTPVRMLIIASGVFGGVLAAHSVNPTALQAAPAPVRVTDQDFGAVQAVCTRCHGVGIFIKQPRTWNRWNEVFIRMTEHGAHPNEEQVDHIVRYFLANLTLVNVNSSPADELGPALGVTEEVASEIVARRTKRPFRDLADLRQMPGIDRQILEERKARIRF